MCESFYVQYGFISSSYSMYTVHKLLLMLFYLETKPPEGRMSIKPQDIAIFSNSHLITEIFPRLITSSTKSKLSRSHKHVGWHLEELCIISHDLCNRDVKKLPAASWWEESWADRSQKTDSCWLSKNTQLFSFSAVDGSLLKKQLCLYVVFCLPVLSMVCC